MGRCQFHESTHYMAIVCRVCGRVVTVAALRDIGLLPQHAVFDCGELSALDHIQPTIHVTLQPLDRCNELIGQEGGHWDRLYLEEV